MLRQKRHEKPFSSFFFQPEHFYLRKVSFKEKKEEEGDEVCRTLIIFIATHFFRDDKNHC